jgi:hypothetical protein
MDFIGQSCGIALQEKDIYPLTLLLYILEKVAGFLCGAWCVQKHEQLLFFSEKKGGSN